MLICLNGSGPSGTGGPSDIVSNLDTWEEVRRMIWIGWGLVWVSMAAAVSVGIIQTGRWDLLIFMVIPALIHIRVDK